MQKILQITFSSLLCMDSAIYLQTTVDGSADI